MSTPFVHRNLPRLLLQAREAVMAHTRPSLREHGLSDQQWRVLRVLGEHGMVETGRVALHAREHAGQAGAEDEGLARDAAGFDHAVLAEHAQHAPLLVAQAMFAQAGPRVGHDGFARLQQQTREVAVGEGGAQARCLSKLLNMLNDWQTLSKPFGIRVCADT